MNNQTEQLLQHHEEIAERIISEVDWTYFEQAYRQHIADADAMARASLIDTVSGLFMDAVTQRAFGAWSGVQIG